MIDMSLLFILVMVYLHILNDIGFKKKNHGASADPAQLVKRTLPNRFKI